MNDDNKNGIRDRDEVAVHGKSLAMGLVLGIFTGGVALSIIVHYVPSMAGLLGILAGTVCTPIESELGRYREAVACFEAGAEATGVNYDLCKQKYIIREDDENDI